MKQCYTPKLGSHPTLQLEVLRKKLTYFLKDQEKPELQCHLTSLFRQSFLKSRSDKDTKKRKKKKWREGRDRQERKTQRDREEGEREIKNIVN